MSSDDGLKTLLAAIGNNQSHDDAGGSPDRLRRLSARALEYRRIRRGMFAEAALRESCWDILLLCFEAEVIGKSICVKQIRSELEESSTSVLRRLQELEDADLVLRQRDEIDGRRTIVRLTREASATLSRFLIQIGDSHG